MPCVPYGWKCDLAEAFNKLPHDIRIQTRRVQSEQGVVTTEDLILTDIDRSLNSSPSPPESYPCSPTELVGSPSRRAPLPPISSPLFLSMNSLVCPETTVAFINTLLLATRLMMSSGAMICPTRHHIRHLSQGSGLRGRTNLNLREDGQENVRNVVSSTPRHNEQQ